MGARRQRLTPSLGLSLVIRSVKDAGRRRACRGSHDFTAGKAAGNALCAPKEGVATGSVSQSVVVVGVFQEQHLWRSKINILSMHNVSEAWGGLGGAPRGDPDPQKTPYERGAA